MGAPGAQAVVAAVCGLPFEAAIAAGPGVAPVCGPGPARVAAGLQALLAGQRPGIVSVGIISFGCAGGLDPGLAPGNCVVATGVLTRTGIVAADPAWVRALLARLPDARAGLVAGMDLPLAAAAGKAQLWRDSGACAVDMESHVAAREAQRLGLPFAACRVVLDPAWRSLPSCALAALRDDGGTALLPLLGALARSPRELAPLCGLAREAWLARRALRHVRAQIGPHFSLP